ncbi:MAG: ROK family protein [Terriglobales bacterium]
MLGYAVGVDLGATNLRVGAVDERGQLLDKISIPIAGLGGSESVIARMCAGIADLTSQFKGTHALRGIGIAIPGIIDIASGILIESPNLPDWSNCPVREEVERRLGTRVILENDANAAAMGEFWLGSAADYTSACMLTLGTGVGGGIILNGALWHGMSGMAGEPGHITIYPDGAPCPCGNRGCLEQYAGARGIVRMAQEAAASGRAPALASAIAANPDFTSGDLYDLAKHGDAAAHAIFETVGRALGIGIAAIINLLNLPILVVAGGGSAGWDLFSPFLMEEVQRRSYVYRAARQPDENGGTQPTKICRAVLGADAGIYGAARLPMLPAEVGEHEQNAS